MATPTSNSRSTPPLAQPDPSRSNPSLESSRLDQLATAANERIATAAQNTFVTSQATSSTPLRLQPLSSSPSTFRRFGPLAELPFGSTPSPEHPSNSSPPPTNSVPVVAAQARKTADVATVVIRVRQPDSSEESEVAFSGRFFREDILALCANRKKPLEETIQATKETIQSAGADCKSYEKQITVLQKKLEMKQRAKREREELLHELQADLANLNKLPLPTSIAHASKRARTQPVSLEGDRLLARIYYSDLAKNLTGKVFYVKGGRGTNLEEARITGFNKAENTYRVSRKEGEIPFKASRGELVFHPEPGEYFARCPEKEGYLPARIENIKPVDAKEGAGVRKFICWLKWHGRDSEGLKKKYITDLTDVLPFGPSHSQAKRLEQDPEGYYHLKEKKQASESKRARSS